MIIVSVCTIPRPCTIHIKTIPVQSQRKSDIDIGRNPGENSHFQGVRIFSQVLFAWSISYNPPTHLYFLFMQIEKTVRINGRPLTQVGSSLTFTCVKKRQYHEYKNTTFLSLVHYILCPNTLCTLLIKQPLECESFCQESEHGTLKCALSTCNTYYMNHGYMGKCFKNDVLFICMQSIVTSISIFLLMYFSAERNNFDN